MDLNDLKKYVFQKCVSHCRSKMQLLENAMSEQKESLFNETKSSAGDKYETGRAMVHLEMEKLSRQSAELRNMLSILQSVDIENVKKTAELGALVKTNQGLYFIAASIGKVTHQDNSVFVISPTSPLGQSMLGLKKGSAFTFRNINYEITSIL